MIAHLQRAHHTDSLLAYLYGPGERGDQSNPRLVGGDCHGAPLDLLTHADTLPYLAHSLDAPVERLGTRAPERPVWVCSIRSDPSRPDLADARWAEVARRLTAVTVAPDGDPDACRWIALRNQPRQVHIVATLAREDGGLHNAYRDAARLQTKCQRVATELGHLPTTPPPQPPQPENSMSLTVTIAPEPSGSVIARGGDTLAQMLLTHAGFAFTHDWHSPRHRLPTSMNRQEQSAIAAQATQMLRAARYTVDLDPSLDIPAAPGAAPPRMIGDHLLDLTDRIRAARSCSELAEEVGPLATPDTGVLDRLVEALEVAEEVLGDLDPRGSAYQLGDRLGVAWEHVGAAQSVLLGIDGDLQRVGGPDRSRDQTSTRTQLSPQRAAVATSPAAAQASAATKAPPATPAAAQKTAGPARNPASRAR